MGMIRWCLPDPARKTVQRTTVKRADKSKKKSGKFASVCGTFDKKNAGLLHRMRDG